MTITLKSKPGLSSTTALSIPDEWSASWFRGFINNMLKGADVRNAVGAGGITVSGNISSPYATITYSGSGALTAPVVINSTAGQVSLTVNTAPGQNGLVVNNSSGSQALTVAANGAVTTTYSAGGIAFKINVTGGAADLNLSADANNSTYLQFTPNASAASSYIGASGAASGIVTGDSANDIGIRSAGLINFANQNSAARIGYFDANGNLNINNGAGSLSPVYAGIPQNSQAGTTYTTVLADANKHIYMGGTTAKTFTIAANVSVAYPIGTAITFVNSGSGIATIAINSDTLYWGNSGATGPRTLGLVGVATALKFTTTAWVISGAGLT